jgi:hypothetical protein
LNSEYIGYPFKGDAEGIQRIDKISIVTKYDTDVKMKGQENWKIEHEENLLLGRAAIAER